MALITTLTVEDILRPLAERPAECPSCHGEGEREVLGQGTVRNVSKNITVASCPPRIPDPRFDALRCKHEEIVELDGPADLCLRCHTRFWGAGELKAIPGIDASLGAIATATSASGFAVRWVCQEQGTNIWTVWLVPTWADSPGATETGASVEEAWARALAAAVGKE